MALNAERERAAQRRLHAQQRRAGLLRSRVVAISLIAFALLWGVVFVQMATGNDPVLGGAAATRKATARRGIETEPRASEEEPLEVEAEPEEEFSEAEAVAEAELAEAEAEFAEVEAEPAPVTSGQS
jgi:uncharacterized iron-regulated membrane protein